VVRLIRGFHVGRNKEDFSVLRMAQAVEQATGFDKKQTVIT
jgi:hypothetical protein